MIWFKRCALVAFLLAISVSSFVSSQDKAAPTRQNDSPAGMDEDTIDLTPSIELVSEKTEGDRGADQIVGQSSLSPLLGQSLLTPGPINTLSLLFPALSSALLWGNLFPPLSFLGPQALLGSTQVLGSSQSDQLPSASKVVLVLAEDRDPHVAMRAANQEAARTIRQNDVFGQLLSQIRQADLGQMLSQSLEQMQQQIPAQLLQQNAEQFLQQIVSQDVSQSLGQMLSQTFQPLPGLDLSQLPLLGQAPPSGEPAVVAALDQAEGGSEAAAAADDVLTPNTPAFQIPNIQSAIDASTQMLGQVFQQPNADANSGFQLPNIQSALDAGTQMLGQAFQQTNADGSSGGFQFPNIQSVIDSGSQMLSQSGGLFNLRPLQSLDPPMSDSDAEPAASQISEVRVKPDVSPTAQNERKMQTAAGMDELKMLSAMQKAFIHKKLPILWFRMPSDSPERDDDFELKHHANSKNKNMDEQLESKLQAFERQVIAELKFLQDIERKAKEMRAASKAGATDKTSKDATNHHASILSKIPVHKITRADIEKALNDDYVKKLLHMAAITNRKASEKTLNGAPSKRQTMTSKSSITPRQMSRDEIMRLLAYAYRMANANGIQMMEVSDSKKLNKPPQSDSEGSAKQLNDENWLRNSKARQWEGERMQMLRMQNFEQNPTRMSMDRQMPEKTTAMGRQSLDEQTPPINENPMQTKPMPMEQQRPAMQQMQRMQSPFTADQRQWIDPNMGMRSWMQENTQMPVQRQWIDTQSQRFPSENTQQPPATTEQSLPAMPILMAMQQPPMMMEEPRMAMQLPQADTQGGDGMMLQQMHPEMQRQMQELDMLGLATPQMPDNEGKARFKGHMFLDDFGKILKGKGKGKGVRPTIINYYYNAGGRRPSHVYSTYAGTSYGGGPSYGTSYGPSYGQSYGPSYGTSYGQSYSQSYGGSSGGAYRMAVGDDEIQAMLKEHNHMATHFRK
ncbi:defective chorion protein, FC106 isoform isoform X2 [Anastrepha ludens]|uniref:defective chorion protein, FC106 isoform isoform X2 n=1 Tax=Anastrepha ludens TaxID=28586 RepID=UPI0023AE9914|nr:defective chorion protein, FC106 isoform isoform X2 [Anastrepha ludens]